VNEEVLRSWRVGSTRQAIVDFVSHICGEEGSIPVPAEERVAVFDNDGTVWCENPTPIQLDFILRRLAEMAAEQPELSAQQPRKVASLLEFTQHPTSRPSGCSSSMTTQIGSSTAPRGLSERSDKPKQTRGRWSACRTTGRRCF
jgi:hypothetical protein